MQQFKKKHNYDKNPRIEKSVDHSSRNKPNKEPLGCYYR